VPQEPDEGVEARARPKPHLVIVELEHALHERRAAADVARVHGGVCFMKKARRSTLGPPAVRLERIIAAFVPHDGLQSRTGLTTSALDDEDLKRQEAVGGTW